MWKENHVSLSPTHSCRLAVAWPLCLSTRVRTSIWWGTCQRAGGAYAITFCSVFRQQLTRFSEFYPMKILPTGLHFQWLFFWAEKSCFFLDHESQNPPASTVIWKRQLSQAVPVSPQINLNPKCSRQVYILQSPCLIPRVASVCDYSRCHLISLATLPWFTIATTIFLTEKRCIMSEKMKLLHSLLMVGGVLLRESMMLSSWKNEHDYWMEVTALACRWYLEHQQIQRGLGT